MIIWQLGDFNEKPHREIGFSLEVNSYKTKPDDENELKEYLLPTLANKAVHAASGGALPGLWRVGR